MKTSLIRRALALLLVLTALIAVVPAAFADGRSIDDIMDMFADSVQKPKSSCVLDNPETAYVRSTYGNCIYVYSRPDKNSKRLFRADEAATVIIYARQAGFALGRVKDTSIGGWMREDLLEKKSRAGKPNSGDTAGLSSRYYRPVRNEYLEDYEIMYVRSKHGNLIYMYNDPTREPLEVVEKVPEGTECTLVARKNSMYFVITELGQRGWVNASQLSYDYWY